MWSRWQGWIFTILYWGRFPCLRQLRNCPWFQIPVSIWADAGWEPRRVMPACGVDGLWRDPTVDGWFTNVLCWGHCPEKSDLLRWRPPLHVYLVKLAPLIFCPGLTPAQNWYGPHVLFFSSTSWASHSAGLCGQRAVGLGPCLLASPPQSHHHHPLPPHGPWGHYCGHHS